MEVSRKEAKTQRRLGMGIEPMGSRKEAKTQRRQGWDGVGWNGVGEQTAAIPGGFRGRWFQWGEVIGGCSGSHGGL